MPVLTLFSPKFQLPYSFSSKLRFQGDSKMPASTEPGYSLIEPDVWIKAAQENEAELNSGPLYEHDVQLLKNVSVYYRTRKQMDQAIAFLNQALILQRKAFQQKFGDDNAQKLEHILNQPVATPKEFVRRVLSAIKGKPDASASKHVTLYGAQQTTRLLKEIADLHWMQGDNDKAIQLMQARPFVIALCGGWRDGNVLPVLNELADAYLRVGRTQEAMPVIQLTLSLLNRRKLDHGATPMGATRSDLMERYIDHMLNRRTPAPSYAVRLLKESLVQQCIPNMTDSLREKFETALKELAAKSKRFAELSNENLQEQELFSQLATGCEQEAVELRTQPKWTKAVDTVTGTGTYL